MLLMSMQQNVEQRNTHRKVNLLRRFRFRLNFQLTCIILRRFRIARRVGLDWVEQKALGKIEANHTRRRYTAGITFRRT
jgi:hypothetical protein